MERKGNRSKGVVISQTIHSVLLMITVLRNSVANKRLDRTAHPKRVRRPVNRNVRNMMKLIALLSLLGVAGPTVVVAVDDTTIAWTNAATRSPKVIVSYPETWRRVHPMHAMGEIEINAPTATNNFHFEIHIDAGEQDFSDLDTYLTGIQDFARTNDQIRILRSKQFTHHTGLPSLRMDLQSEERNDHIKRMSFILMDLGERKFVTILVVPTPPEDHAYARTLEEILKRIEIDEMRTRGSTRTGDPLRGPPPGQP